MSERLEVLRLGYRKGRDPRITTHLALVARAMGADGFLLAGDEDKEMFENLNSEEKITEIKRRKERKKELEKKFKK